MYDSPDALLHRIHADLWDGHDEALEMEIEDRHLDGLDGETSPEALLQQKESRRRWALYTKAKEVMIERTHTPDSPWWVVPADDKKKARLNCIPLLRGGTHPAARPSWLRGCLMQGHARRERIRRACIRAPWPRGTGFARPLGPSPRAAGGTPRQRRRGESFT